MTDIKRLAMVPGQALVMLKFAPVPGPQAEAGSQSSGDRRLLALTEQARDIIGVAAPDGTLHYVSGGGRQLLGSTPQGRGANNLFGHVRPGDREALRPKNVAVA